MGYTRRAPIYKRKKNSYKRRIIKGGGTPHNEDAVICCIVKDEELYLEEWISYHLKLGFSKIYIYDNSDNFSLKHFFDDTPYKNKIDIIHFPGKSTSGSHRNIEAYTHFFENHSKKHTWLAIIDCDEFITLVNPEPISKFLKKHCVSGALGISWRIFGDSGETEYTARPVLERFIKCEEKPDKHVKCITRCEDILNVPASHHTNLKPGKYQKDTLGNNMGVGPFNNNPTLELIYINHYYGKSRGEYQNKRKRGVVDRAENYEMTDFNRHNINEVEDTKARDFMKGPLDFSINNTTTLSGGNRTIPTFHILICTAGRPSLKRMIDSLRDQLAANDAITIIFDGPDALKKSTYTDDWANGFKCPFKKIEQVPQLGSWGHVALNKYQSNLDPKTTYVMNADDDDMYVEGVFNKLREKLTDPNKLYIARMTNSANYTNRTKFIPKNNNLSIKPGNIGKPCGIIPFNKVGEAKWGLTYLGDFDYYNSLKDKVDSIEFINILLYKIK